MSSTRDRVATIDHDLIIDHTYEVVVKAIAADGRMEAVDVAPRATILLEGKLSPPQAPTSLVAPAFVYTIFLTWTNPYDSDFDVTEVWFNTVDDRATATKLGEVKGDTFPDNVGESGITRYYWVRARNTSGIVGDWNQSAGVAATTTEVQATDIADFAVTATKMFTNAIILTGDVWTNNSPTGGKIAWNQHSVVYGGASCVINAGNTSNKYVYWTAGSHIYSTSTSHPTLGADGFMIAMNTSGIRTPVWNSSANMVIGTAFIEDAAITSAKIGALAVDTGNIAALAVTDAKINNLASGKITLASGKYWAGEDGATVGADWATNLSNIPAHLAATAPDNSVSITSTFIGFHSTGSTWPIKIQNDSGTGKFYAGNGSSKFMSWDGTDLTVAGSIKTAVSGKRIVLDPADNNVKLYDDGGNLRVTIDGNSDPMIDISYGSIDLEAGTLKINGTQVVSTQGAAVANATDAATTMARLNDLLARLRTHGLIAT